MIYIKLISGANMIKLSLHFIMKCHTNWLIKGYRQNKTDQNLKNLIDSNVVVRL